MAEVSRTLGKGWKTWACFRKDKQCTWTFEERHSSWKGFKSLCLMPHRGACDWDLAKPRSRRQEGRILAMFTNVLPPYQKQWNSISPMFQLFFLLHIPWPRHACKYCPALSTLKQMLPLSCFCHLLFKYVRLNAAYTLFCGCCCFLLQNKSYSPQMLYFHWAPS